MWLNVIRILWPIIYWIYCLKSSIVTTYSPRKKRQQVCGSHNWEGHPSLARAAQFTIYCLCQNYPARGDSWKWIWVGVSRPVSLQQRSRAAAGEVNLTPIHIAPFSKWRCSLRNRIHLTLCLPFMSTMNRIIL